MMTTRLATTVTLAAAMLMPAAARAQGPGFPELTREQELRLAMSAGPLSVSEHADVYVMGPAGFERAVTGTNGWACLVVRGNDKRQLAPHCLNPAAVTGVLPAFLREAAMQVQGRDGQAIDAEIRRLYASRELSLPADPAFAYMLSEGQRLGPNLTNFKPHFMLYLPYATNEALGGNPAQHAYPFVGPYENHPLSTLVVVMTAFVSPQDVTLPGRWPTIRR